MKTKSLLTSLFILIGLVAATGASYALARFIPTPVGPAPFEQPPQTPLNLPPQTQNGYTATVESYYADASRLIFQVRVAGGDGMVGNVEIFDENGDFVNSSTGWGPALGNDPSVSQMEFNTVTPLPGDRFNGQLAFSYIAAFGDMQTLADFRFDLDIPIHPALTFYPKQTVTANGVDMWLDRVIITPANTQIYLCYPKPTEADWGVSRDTSLTIDGQTASIFNYALLFDPALADGSKGGEPGWTPPTKEERCIKIGFPIGDANPTSLTLTISSLEESMPEVIPQEKLDAAYPKLLAQGIDMEWITLDHGSTVKWKKIPANMTEQEAMLKFIEALGYTYTGPWEFSVTLK